MTWINRSRQVRVSQNRAVGLDARQAFPKVRAHSIGGNTMLRRRTLLSLLVFVGIAATAHAQGAYWPKVVEAANHQGHLNILHNTPPPMGDLWLAEFHKAFPAISVEATRLGSSDLMQRFNTEYGTGASQNDVLITLWDDTL